MTFFQIAIKDKPPSGGLFRTRAEALREIEFLKADDRRYAAEALEEAGVVVERIEYVIHEVTAFV